jgi:phosphatidylglycerophosphatase A
MVTNPIVRALVIVLATAGGAGYAPVASGTVGSLVAMPLVPWLARIRDGSWPTGLLVATAIAAIVIWSAGRAEQLFGGKDHSRIVIDEVAGMATAALFVPATWLAAAVVFVIFRVFDVLKPYPAGLIDRRGRGGFGVVGDDLVAGAYAGIVTRLVFEIFREAL